MGVFLKTLALSLALFASSAFAQYVPWVEGSIVGVKRNSPQDGPAVLYINTTPGAGYSVPYSNGYWGVMDVSSHVPQGTKAVYIGGILSVLGGTVFDGCNLTGAFTAGDVTTDNPYIVQAILNPSQGTGTRVPVGFWVALDSARSMRFKISWWTNSGDVSLYPVNCAYFVNLQIEAYLR